MIEFFRDNDGKHRFRISGTNGEVMVTSEPYSTESNARRGLVDLRHVLATAEVPS